MRKVVRGVDLDGLLEVGDRLRDRTCRFVHRAAQEPAARPLRVEPQRPVVVGNRGFVLLQPRVAEGAVEPRIEAVGIDGERPAVVGDGAVKFEQAFVVLAARVPGLFVLRILLDRIVVAGEGAVEEVVGGGLRRQHDQAGTARDVPLSRTGRAFRSSVHVRGRFPPHAGVPGCENPAVSGGAFDRSKRQCLFLDLDLALHRRVQAADVVVDAGIGERQLRRLALQRDRGALRLRTGDRDLMRR